MAFGLGKNSISVLETQFEKSKAEHATAESAFSSAVQAMECPPLEMDDEQIADLVNVKNLAEVRLIQARAGVRRAEHALNQAKAAAAEKERADALARVMSLGTSAQKIAREELAAATKGMRRAIRAMAEAEAARIELNATLPADQRLVESFEFAVIGRPGVPEKVVSQSRTLRWVNSAGRDFDFEPDDLTRLVEDRGAGTAILKGRSAKGEHDIVLTRRRYFEHRVTLPEIHPRMQGSLSETVQLPGLAGGPAGWVPVGTGSALRMLSELEAQASAKAPERAPVERTEAVSPVFKSNEELAAWDANSEQDQSEAA